MTDTTTIQITQDQAEELRNRKQHDGEAYKSVIGRLLEQQTGQVDYTEIERRCERAVEAALPKR